MEMVRCHKEVESSELKMMYVQMGVVYFEAEGKGPQLRNMVVTVPRKDKDLLLKPQNTYSPPTSYFLDFRPPE